jgi:hypothetical protein
MLATSVTMKAGRDNKTHYRVRCFGLASTFDYHVYDVHEEDLVNFENTVVESLEEVAPTNSQELRFRSAHRSAGR